MARNSLLCADVPLRNYSLTSDFRDIRNKYFVASTMKDVFEHVSMRNVINFIKETHFYNLL